MKVFKKTFKHRLFKNTSALLMMQLFTYVAPFLVLPYLSRMLGPDGFGLMVAALSLTVIANVCTDFGFDLSATYLISRKQNQKKYISKIISSIYSLKLPLLVLVFIGIAIYLNSVKNYTTLAVIAIYLNVLFQAFISPWLFQGIEKMKLITYSTIASRVVYVCLIFIFVKEKNDYDVALMCNAAAAAIACILANLLIFKEGFVLVKPPRRLVKLVVHHSSQFFISRVTLEASSSLSTLVLASSVASAQVGMFGASQRLYGAFKQLVSPFSQALYPYMAKTGNTKLLLKLVSVIALIMILPVSIGLVFAEQILDIIFGEEFKGSSDILRVFIITGYVAFLSICFGYPAFAALKRVDLANKSVIVSGSCHVFILIILTSTNNISSITLVYSILFTEVLTLSLRVFWFTKVRK